MFPDWPFAKPRFVLDQGDKLVIVNRPLLKAEDISLPPYIHDLPFIEYDRAYRPTEWDRSGWWYILPFVSHAVSDVALSFV